MFLRTGEIESKETKKQRATAPFIPIPTHIHDTDRMARAVADVNAAAGESLNTKKDDSEAVSVFWCALTINVFHVAFSREYHCSTVRYCTS
jgi:hypothetical protein